MGLAFALVRHAAVILAGLVLLTSAGCSHAPTRLNEQQVTAAFEGAGLHRPSGLIKLFDGKVLGTDVRELSWDSEPGTHSPSVEVEIFPSIREAAYVVTIGGNIETADGARIKPLGQVANVVVTLYPDATRDECARSLRALSILRNDLHT